MNRLRPGLVLLSSLLLGGCSQVPITPEEPPSALDPRGPNAAHLAALWWVMLALGAAIFPCLRTAGRGPPAQSTLHQRHDSGKRQRRCGAALGGLGRHCAAPHRAWHRLRYTIYTLAALQDPQGPAAVHVQIVGRRWWWDASYPDQGITSPNELLHLPLGKPVQIRLESADVISS